MKPRLFFYVYVILLPTVAVGGAWPPGDSTGRVIDAYGAIVRGDVTQKEMALVLTGDLFADGGPSIRGTLRKHGVKASFFLTGNFYNTPAFAPLVRALKKDGHYLGAHSDKHLLYCSWTARDSLLVTKDEFLSDLNDNYRRMKKFGVRKKDARYFMPPYEWYNATITRWTSEAGLRLVNFTPGTRSAADYTFPEMGARYVSSADIFESVLRHHATDAHGLNGFLLLVHIGTDPKRTDKFYDRLDSLLVALKREGYSFVRIDELLD